MKKIVKSGKIIIVLISLLFGAVLSGCDQEALFWDIAHEYPPIEPDIGGRPTKIVENGTVLYVSNNTNHLWKYNMDDGEPHWDEVLLPNFAIRDLAVADDTLFALDRGGNIFMFDGSAWDPSPIYSASNIEKLFGAGIYLYISAKTGDLGGEHSYKQAYEITCLNISGGVEETIPNTGLLMGAVYDGSEYYLGTLGGGLYSGTDGTNLLLTRDTTTYGDTIIGLTVHNGKVFILGPSTIYFPTTPVTAINPGYSLSGAVAGWTVGTDHLLLVGVQHSSGSFGYGYRELYINGGAPGSGLVVPGGGIDVNGKRLSSVVLGSQYVSAIGEHAVNNFYVCNDMTTKKADGDGRPVIFGATVKDGLWSYRTRSGNAQWNGEDRTPF